MILLELLTGQRPTDPTQRPAVLYARMRRCLPAEAPAVSDASCDWGAGAATDLGSLAKQCVAAEADDRPGMEEVLEMLDGMQEGLARTGPGVVKPPMCVRWHHAWDTMHHATITVATHICYHASLLFPSNACHIIIWHGFLPHSVHRHATTDSIPPCPRPSTRRGPK